jgi:hypothetical protein
MFLHDGRKITKFAKGRPGYEGLDYITSPQD